MVSHSSEVLLADAFAELYQSQAPGPPPLLPPQSLPPSLSPRPATPPPSPPSPPLLLPATVGHTRSAFGRRDFADFPPRPPAALPGALRSPPAARHGAFQKLLWHGLLTFGAAVPEITARAQLGQVSGLESRSRRPNRGQKRGGERALSSSAGDSSQPEGGEGWGKEAFRPPLYEAFAETRISTFTALLPVQRALLRNGVLKNQQNTKKDFARS